MDVGVYFILKMIFRSFQPLLYRQLIDDYNRDYSRRTRISDIPTAPTNVFIGRRVHETGQQLNRMFPSQTSNRCPAI